jgi:hypothetical protein
LAQIAVGVVDGLDEVGKARRLLARPQPLKGRAEQLHVSLSQQSDSDDPILRQAMAPSVAPAGNAPGLAPLH